MMKQTPSNSPEPRACRHAALQQGHALLEALVGILLFGVVGLGMTFVAVRNVQSQHQASNQAAVVQAMRHTLQVKGIDALCSQSALDPLTLTRKHADNPDKNDWETEHIHLPVELHCHRSPGEVRVRLKDENSAQLQSPSTGSFDIVLQQPVLHIEMRTAASSETADRLIHPGSIRIKQ